MSPFGISSETESFIIFRRKLDAKKLQASWNWIKGTNKIHWWLFEQKEQKQIQNLDGHRVTRGGQDFVSEPYPDQTIKIGGNLQSD